MGDTKTISIVEGNKVIAEFMGVKYQKSAFELPYHDWWNHLMLVVEKIGKWYDEESDTVNVDDFLETNLKIFNLTIFSSINEVWFACIEFINWYNQNLNEAI